MIKSFKNKETAFVFREKRTKKFSISLQKQAKRKLEMLDSAVNLEDLRSPPRNFLEALVGDRKGQHSIRINDQFRVCFRWETGNSYDVEIVDYHK